MNKLLRLTSLAWITAAFILFSPPVVSGAESLSGKALRLLRTGQPKQAAVLLAKPARNDAGLSAILGWAHLRLNDPNAAETAFRRSIALRSEQSDAYCGLGYVDLRRGRSSEATASFKKGLGYGSRTNLDCLAGLAMALEQAGDRDGAKETAAAVLKREPANESALAVLRRLEASDVRPVDDPARIALDVHRKGDLAEARTLLAKIVAGGSMSEPVLAALADSHYRLGSTLEAVDVYRLMLSRRIGVERATAELATIYGIPPEEVVWWRKPTPPPRPRPDKPKVSFRAKGDYFEYHDGKEWRRTYLVGVNIGPAPPGEFASTAPRDVATYAAWFRQMADMGSNMVRAYTILPPAFYAALLRHNEKAPRPLWLLQEIWLSELEERRNLFDPLWTGEFREESRRVVDLLHGNAVIPHRPGHASGVYTADVSPYVFAIAPGREVEASIVLTTNRLNPERTSFSGRYVRVNKGSPSEVWFAMKMEDVAAYEMERYHAQRPLTIVNWPPLDPMNHVTEANYIEELTIRKRLGEPVEMKLEREVNDSDAVSLDVMNLKATPEFPAGLFATFHVYTYWPDFLLYDPEYPKARDHLGSNRYFGYLLDLKSHHRGMPLLVAEYGVPTSWAIAHLHPDGWHNGGFSEKAQAELLERMTRNIRDSACAGGLVFAWLDEWWKSVADNFTRPFDQPPERRPLWQNMLNPEENFGVVGYRPAFPVPLLRGNEKDWEGATTVAETPEGRIRAVRAMSDYAYLYLRLDLAANGSGVDWQKEAFWVALSTLPNRAGSRELPKPAPRLAEGASFLLKVDHPERLTLLMAENFHPNEWIANTFVPGKRLIQRKKDVKPVLVERSPFVEMITQANPPRWGRDGTVFPPLFVSRSVLPAGTADPASPNSSTLAAWHVSRTGSMIEVRIPWGLLYVADPSSLLFYGGTDSQAEPVWTRGEAIGMAVMHLALSNEGPLLLESLPRAKGGRIEGPLPSYSWKGWNQVQATPYLKPAYHSLQRSFRKLLEEAEAGPARP